jgi:hypothetical protein
MGEKIKHYQVIQRADFMGGMKKRRREKIKYVKVGNRSKPVRHEEQSREQFFLKGPFCKAGMNGKKGKILTGADSDGRVTIYQNIRGHTDQDAVVVTVDSY